MSITSDQQATMLDLEHSLIERHDRYIPQVARESGEGIAIEFIAHAPKLVRREIVCAACEPLGDELYPCLMVRSAAPESADVYVARLADGSLAGPYRTADWAEVRGSVETVRDLYGNAR